MKSEKPYILDLNFNSASIDITVVADKTTGIFCRPNCSTTSKRGNKELFSSPGKAMFNGYRPCKICKPLESFSDLPQDIENLLRRMETDPLQKVSNSDLESMGLDTEYVRRWFLQYYGQTFTAFQRMYRSNSTFQRYLSHQNMVDNAGNPYDNLMSDFNTMLKDIVKMSQQKYENKSIVHITLIETELGLMVAGSTDKGICMLEFADFKLIELELGQLISTFKLPLHQSVNTHLEKLISQLEQYFKGEREEFDLPLDLVGTEFQKLVWLSLLKIPYGQTINYAKQAELIGKPSAVRAVANANGKNKISIVLPCHRVIGADGTLTGYGGGMWRKRILLKFESENSTI